VGATIARDGSHVATAGEDGTVRVWNPARRATPVRVLRGGGGELNVVAFSRDGRHVAAGEIHTRTQAACAKPPCPAEPATVNEVVFAAERVIPAVDLGERSRVRVTGPTATALACCGLLGWILTIALLAAATKTLRRD
jgi:hypothetical protein